MAPGELDSGEAPQRSTKRARPEGSKKAKPGHSKSKSKIKCKGCRICLSAKHTSVSCPLTVLCSSLAKVGPDAEILCLCCGEDVAVAHPNEIVASRACFKPDIWIERNPGSPT